MKIAIQIRDVCKKERENYIVEYYSNGKKLFFQETQIDFTYNDFIIYYNCPLCNELKNLDFREIF